MGTGQASVSCSIAAFSWGRKQNSRYAVSRGTTWAEGLCSELVACILDRSHAADGRGGQSRVKVTIDDTIEKPRPLGTLAAARMRSVLEL
jgi:hypothetical protein